MGKAVIVGGGAGGLYSVKLEYSGLDGAIAQIEARRAALEARIPQLEAALAQAENDRAQAKQAAESLLNDWLAGVPIAGEALAYEWSPKAMQYAQEASEAMKVPAALINAIGNVQQASMAAAAADSALNAAYADYLSVTTREAELDRLKTSTSATISAWCADYTENLSGTVATVEVPGEVNPKIGGGVNIRPGYVDAAWSSAYGQLQPATILSEAGFAWNFTMIQPWIKWRPLWRYGTVTGKDEDNDTLDVSLHPILSKAGAWLAKQTDFNDYVGDSLSAVSVDYMWCGAKAFESGDDVVVEFRQSGDTYSPVVIGFKSNPKECPDEYVWPTLDFIIYVTGRVGSLSVDGGSKIVATEVPGTVCGDVWQERYTYYMSSQTGGLYQTRYASGYEFSQDSYLLYDKDLYPINLFYPVETIRELDEPQQIRREITLLVNRSTQSVDFKVKQFTRFSEGWPGGCIVPNPIWDYSSGIPVFVEWDCTPAPCYYEHAPEETEETLLHITSLAQFESWAMQKLSPVIVTRPDTGETKTYSPTRIELIRTLGEDRLRAIYEPPAE